MKNNILREINEWVQKGFEITYDVLCQKENGYEKEVEAGHMPRFTYTIYVREYEKEDYIFIRSTDSLEVGFAESLKWLKETQK